MQVGRSRSCRAMTTRRRRAGGSAWLAALTISVLAVTPLLTIFHQISARHAVCEHGELVESGHNGPATGEFGAGMPGAPARDAQTLPTTGIRAESDAISHGHNHCSVGTLAKNNVALLPSTEVVTALSEVAVGNSGHCEFAYVRTILLSAPKTSPPHASS
jgi:hypothetical protein